MRKGLILICAVLILGLVNLSIWQHEQLLKHGETVLLELAPVDPRSLMQGDYMALHFAMADGIAQQLQEQKQHNNRSGTVIVQLDADRRASLVALDKQQPLENDQLRLQFRLRNGQVQFATDAFFFQEGTGQRYAAAQYGLFRVGKDGQLLPTHLADAELQILGQTQPLQSATP